MTPEKKHEKCTCPYCENELEMGCFEPAFCSPCGVELVACAACGKRHSKKETKCPYCGALKKG